MILRRICWFLFASGVVFAIGCNSILGIDDVPTPVATNSQGTGPGDDAGAEMTDGQAMISNDGGGLSDGGPGSQNPTCTFDNTASGFDTCNFAP